LNSRTVRRSLIGRTHLPSRPRMESKNPRSVTMEAHELVGAIKKLSIDERIRIMEEISDSITQEEGGLT
jgi:hypothetical protein